MRSAARALLETLADSVSGEWVFPDDRQDQPLTDGAHYWFWAKAGDMARIVADTRLPHLRHAHASHAVMNRESLHVAGPMLGHRRASATNRYVHLPDTTLNKPPNGPLQRFAGN